VVEDVVWAILFGIGLLFLLITAGKLAFIPLSLVFQLKEWRRRRSGAPTLADEEPFVSIIIPGYNEEMVLDNCVTSILNCGYPEFEIILVNDGSTDDTATVMARLADSDDRVTFVDKPNGGKGSALNLGTQRSRGEILMYVDADGVFGPDTITEVLRGFTDEHIGAVSGDDRPVNLDRVLTRLLALISHLGTGFVRRALAIIHALPIVSGNMGAFRRRAIDEVGGLHEDTLGEDLELTWRMHRAGWGVNFAPRAVVWAESPSTWKGLWRQRTRWARGLLQVTWAHRDMVGNPRYGMFGLYLAFNTLTMIIMPPVLLVALVTTAIMVVVGDNPLPATVWGWLGFLGVALTLGLLLYAIALNRAWKDLRHIWTFPVLLIYSFFITFTMVWAIYLELRGAPQVWNKLARTGVVSGEQRQAIEAPRPLLAPSPQTMNDTSSKGLPRR